jgi:hypothetical protein
MILPLPSSDALLVTVILVTLAIGLPILVVLSIVFLLDRNLNLGRSKELERLIWQLHRIASAMEQQVNLSSPAAPEGTEKPRGSSDDVQQVATQPTATTQNVAASAPAPATQSVRVKRQQASVPRPAPRKPSADGEGHGGVNSMFGL